MSKSKFVPKEASETPWEIEEAAIGFIVLTPYPDYFGMDETPVYCLTRERAEKIANIPVLAHKVAKEGLSDFSPIWELIQIIDKPQECEDWKEDFSPLLQLWPTTWPKAYPWLIRQWRTKPLDENGRR